MKAMNVVRMRVKPGFEQQFVEFHRQRRSAFKGFLGGSVIQTGERTFCLIGEWRSQRQLVAARPEMIATLDEMRHMLEDLGGETGVTDPVSGEVVAKLAAPRAKKKAAKKKVAKKKVAKKKVAKKKAAKKKGKKK